MDQIDICTYIKGQNNWQMRNHASWMIKKIMNAKHIIDQVQQVQGKGKRMIRKIYWYMKKEHLMPAWNCLMFNNAARPKAYFTIWIMLNQKLATVDRLVQWGVVVDKNCVLCKCAEESIEQLLLQCQYARIIGRD